MLNEIYQSLNPVAFTIGPYEARWYGIAYVLGFFLAGVVIYRTARHWKMQIPAEDVLVLMLSVAVGVIMGARLFYVVF